MEKLTDVGIGLGNILETFYKKRKKKVINFFDISHKNSIKTFLK